jgi:SAM-dependent methyltransferase
MHDEEERRVKARKMREVLRHFHGTADLVGLTILDVGSSTGYISDELTRAGARVIGVDIDVPGLAQAVARFGDRVTYVCGDGSSLPFADDAFDVIILNQIYQHVVDPAALMAELRRVLRVGGVAYFGFTNKVILIEPHYRLPFLSLIPRSLGHRYVRLAGRASRYHEELKTYGQLLRMCRGWEIWDYTASVLLNPRMFAAEDAVPRVGGLVPAPVYRALRRFMPSYIWIGVNGHAVPAGPAIDPPVRRLTRS